MYRRLIVITAVIALLGQAVLLPAVALGGGEQFPDHAPSTADRSAHPVSSTGSLGSVGSTDSADPERATSVLVVDDDGSTGFASIQAAVAAASDGDTIRVRPGEYSPDGSVRVSKNVTITAPDGATITGKGYPGQNTTVSGADFPPAFEIGRHASPVIVGFTIRGRPAVDAVETRGDFVLRNLTVVEPVRTAIEAHGTSGDWLAQNLTIVTNATAVGVGDTTGAWTIRDSTIEYRDGGERQVDPAIHAHGSSSAWTIRNTSVEGYLVGIEAEHTSGDWTLSGVAVRDTTVGVSAYRSTGDWTIRQSVFRNTTVSDNIDFLSAPLTEGVAVFADQTNGSWTIRNTRFNASSEVDISAVDAAVRGDARGNVWDGSTTPDEDACTGNVTCAGSPDGDPVGTPTPTGDEPNPYQTVVTAGDGKHPLAAGDGQVVAGRTNLSAGTEVVVTLRSTNGTTFGASRTTVVDDEGRFRAVFDLSSLAVGTGYDVFVERAGERLATVSGTLVDCIACTETDSGAAITTITSDGENVTVVAEPGQAIYGQTDLLPGTTVTIRLTYISGKPFIMTGEATVGADGRFRAVFNFTGIDAGTTFEVTVRRDDGTLATTEGVVVDCGKRPDASVCRDQPTETAKPNGTETATPAETGTTTRTSAEPTATRIGTQVPESHDSDWLVVFGLLGVGGVFGIVGVALLLGVVEI